MNASQNHADGCLSLVVSTFMPYIIVTGTVEKPKVEGTMLEVLEIIFRHLGYCYSIQAYLQLSGGRRSSNGSWDGAMGYLHRREADMTGLGYVVSEDRFQDFEIGEYMYLDESTASYARPRLDQHVDGFLRPYTAMVWLMILVMTVVVLVTLCLVHVLRHYIIHQSYGLPDSRLVPADTVAQNAVKDSIMWTVYTFLAQSARRVPFGDSVRIVSGLWLLVCLILASVYRSNLKAMLILPKVTVPFDSLEQLVKTDLPVWVAPQSVLYNVAMMSPPNTSLGKLNRMFIGTDKPIDIPWGVRDLVAGKHALTGPKSALVQILHSTFSQTGKCANYLMSEAFLKSYMLSIIFPKGSPLKKKVDKVIVSLREAGILDHLYKKGVSNATECLKPITTKPSQEVRTLDIGDVYGVFLVYLGGMVLAILVFALELLAAIMGRQPRLLDISLAPPVLKG